jgi:cob(I)alamin adenosyltransferase
MDKEEVLSMIQSIGTDENEVSRRESLTNLSEKITELYANIDTLNTTINENNETIKKNNEDMESLRQANMKLFLKVGESKSPEEKQMDSTGISDPESNKKEKLKFEDLFK